MTCLYSSYITLGWVDSVEVNMDSYTFVAYFCTMFLGRTLNTMFNIVEERTLISVLYDYVQIDQRTAGNTKVLKLLFFSPKISLK